MARLSHGNATHEEAPKLLQCVEPDTETPQSAAAGAPLALAPQLPLSGHRPAAAASRWQWRQLRLEIAAARQVPQRWMRQSRLTQRPRPLMPRSLLALL